MRPRKRPTIYENLVYDMMTFQIRWGNIFKNGNIGIQAEPFQQKPQKYSCYSMCGLHAVVRDEVGSESV